MSTSRPKYCFALAMFPDCEAARRDDVLLALVLHVGGLAHEAERPVALLLRERDPGERREAHHLDLAGPVLALRRLQPVAQRRDLLGVLLRGRGIAASRRTEGARNMRHRLRKRVLARRRLQLRRLAPRAALERIARRNRRERVRSGGARRAA